MALDDLLLKVKNRRLVMMIAPIVLGVFLGGIMVIRPSLSSLASIRAQKNAVTSKANAFNEVISWEKKLSAYKSRLAPIEDKAKTIEELGAAATAAGLSVSSITADEKKITVSFMQRVSVRIEAEGNYHELGQFVSLVENMKSFTKVLSAAINAGPGGDSSLGAGAATSRASSPAAAVSSDNYKMTINVGLFFAPKDAL